ncbi:hypothetical protein [Desulfogranum japonicum]|uniref:hypothetical protein n=1 Tax=Desulfogranum japonicum TaxID=231447 RepID=UPI00048ABC37|nr:hypothetical protein [Desulfogranum japonicum]
MKRIIWIYLVSLIVATAIVFLSLQQRQEPKRTGPDAYIPIRTITPLEAAVIIVSNSNRKPDSYARIIIVDLTDKNAVILTRNYVIPTEFPTQHIPESYDGVTINGKSFRIVSNSWENYVCQYVVDRIALEQILGYHLSMTEKSDIKKNGFNKDKISFSSKKIWMYMISEILAISILLTIIIEIFTKLHFLLWLPCLTTLDIALALYVKWYSPAFFDADNFFQRIIIEEIPLRFSLGVGYLLFNNLFLLPIISSLSLATYIIYRSTILLRNKKIT